MCTFVFAAAAASQLVLFFKWGRDAKDNRLPFLLWWCGGGGGDIIIIC